MTRLPTSVLLAATTAALAGCGDSPASIAADAAGQVAQADAACETCAPGSLAAVFVFDQSAKQIVRLIDRDRDGRMMDAGEVSVFFDDAGPLGIYNSMGMVARGPDELLATDNVAGEHNSDANVIRLVDRDGDGDALGEGEATTFWSGALPGGGALSFPIALAADDDGALLLVQNDAFDDQADAIFRLTDGDGDGDVDDPGEVATYRDLAAPAPTPQFLDAVFDDRGVGFGVDLRNPGAPFNASLDQLAGDGERVELIDSAGLYTLTQTDQELILPGTGSAITFDGAAGEVLIQTMDRFVQQASHLVGLRDVDGSGRIDRPDEIRVRFDEEAADVVGFGAFRDMVWLPDGSVVGGDASSKRLLRLVDRDGDGGFDDPGEVETLYDATAAAAAGVHAAGDLMTIAVALY